MHKDMDRNDAGQRKGMSPFPDVGGGPRLGPEISSTWNESQQSSIFDTDAGIAG
jgi:hypothetical protein